MNLKEINPWRQKKNLKVKKLTNVKDKNNRFIVQKDKYLNFIKLIQKKSDHLGRTETYLNIYKTYKIKMSNVF